MRLTAGIFACFVIAGAPAIAGGQDPAGYTRMGGSMLPDTLREVFAGGRFRISVLRGAADTLERRLITIAESLIPPRDSIERQGRAVSGSGHVRAQQAAAAMPGARWWWRDWDGVLLPYALTGQAVAHYVERVRILAAGPSRFAHSNPGVAHQANVEYTARVVRRERGAGSVEVHLEVRFGFYCGGLCALSFTHTRVVEFDSAGRVVRVGGDHPPAYLVS